MHQDSFLWDGNQERMKRVHCKTDPLQKAYQHAPNTNACRRTSTQVDYAVKKCGSGKRHHEDPACGR
jgi:hypothetical protein